MNTNLHNSEGSTSTSLQNHSHPAKARKTGPSLVCISYLFCLLLPPLFHFSLLILLFLSLSLSPLSVKTVHQVSSEFPPSRPRFQGRHPPIPGIWKEEPISLCGCKDGRLSQLWVCSDPQTKPNMHIFTCIIVKLYASWLNSSEKDRSLLVWMRTSLMLCKWVWKKC